MAFSIIANSDSLQLFDGVKLAGQWRRRVCWYSRAYFWTVDLTSAWSWMTCSTCWLAMARLAASWLCQRAT
jgi:hypothetical protein